MSFLIVPNEVSQNSATVWVGAINENFNPQDVRLHFASSNGTGEVHLHSGWDNFSTADGSYRMSYRRVPLNNLGQRTWHSLALRVGNDIRADGSVITLPDRLPNAGDRPFTVLLGSCFFGNDDTNGEVGRTYLELPNAAKPEIKILCGDQVYLDNPFRDFLNPFHGHNWLEARSFKTYAETWSQWFPWGGFNRMLKHEANFFSSDDHEFWNNAPDIGFNVPFYAATQGGREDWRAIGRQLYQIFQTSPSPPIKFKVDPLSFCIADTRFFRGSGKDEGGDFMKPDDLLIIGDWARHLPGPGVLVIGQPFLANPGGRKDYTLPNFTRQYEQLKGFLKESEHSIVILTGDVHFGRISSASLRPELGTRLYEVISSPMQLVSKVGAGYEAAPQVFGSVTSEPEFSLDRNHFLTLDFMAPSPQRASMLVKFWPIIQGIQSQPQILGGGQIELI